MNTDASRPMYEWSTLPWRTLTRQVFKLQKRIYQASQRGDVKAVHQLQRLLMQSWSAKCLAVRKVTQDNRGKHTAGVDGVKSLAPHQRLVLAATLRIPNKALPTRRVWIPKPGSAEQRPLGIPTLHDRAAQALAKLALEPEWEARFEPNSYGFRPGRSTHDAIGALFNLTNRVPKYVLDADLTKCFDRINHEGLLTKLDTAPVLRRAIRAWLKAGVMDGPDLFPTKEGTPQGGVVSPLLANIALHGLETAVRQGRQWHRKAHGYQRAPHLVRYADDFVIVHEDLRTLLEARAIVVEWLAAIGLELNPAKTRIVHTRDPHEGHPAGFDFLGFNVRLAPTGQTHQKKGTTGRRLAHTVCIRPSDEAMKRHQKDLSDTITRMKAATQESLIVTLAPKVTGWARYYRTVASSRWFAKADYRLHQRLRRWCRRRHRNKSGGWQRRRYWVQGWVFGPRNSTLRLPLHQATRLQRHAKVQGTRSPYDGDWAYWSQRMGRHPELPKRVATLLQWQRGRCKLCGLPFTIQDLLEIDHIVPRSQGGTDEYRNWQLLHRHCHDQSHALTTHRDTEEPDEAKVSRPVLEAGGGR